MLRQFASRVTETAATRDYGYCLSLGAQSFAARLKSLDKDHPLAYRTAQVAAPLIHRAIKSKYQRHQAQFPTRLRRTDLLLPACKRPTLLAPRLDQRVCLQTASKEESAAEFSRWLQQASLSTLIVYSDGSLSEEGAAGYGYTVHQQNSSISHGSGRIGHAEVFDAEAIGALEGLKAALKLPQAPTQEIIVCLDNLAAATCVHGTASDSSQAVFLEYQALAAAHGATHVRWIPGHTSIPGNEQADKLAKMGCSLPQPPNAIPTLAHLRRIARQRLKTSFELWWRDAAPERYKGFELRATNKCPPELKIPRPALHHLLAARTYHGDFADYHERFNHADARLTCSCGRRKSPTHIFYCRKILPHHRIRLTPTPERAISRTLGCDFDRYTELGAKSSFFSTVCRRH